MGLELHLISLQTTRLSLHATPPRCRFDDILIGILLADPLANIVLLGHCNSMRQHSSTHTQLSSLNSTQLSTLNPRLPLLTPRPLRQVLIQERQEEWTSAVYQRIRRRIYERTHESVDEVKWSDNTHRVGQHGAQTTSDEDELLGRIRFIHHWNFVKV